jgi:hypothetical protein
MNRRSAATWVENEIMGELVPPELACLVNRLKLVNVAADTRIVVEHSRKIYTACQLWRGCLDRYGFKISGSKRRRVERVKATRGLKDDLTRLLSVARGGSAKEWEKAWLGVAGEARSLVAPPAPPILERHLDDNGNLIGFRRAAPAARPVVTAPRFQSVIPDMHEAIPRIEAALAERTFSGKREIDKMAYIFALRVCDAYLALAGKKGLTFDPSVGDAGSLGGGLLDFANDIDDQFGTDVLTVRRLRDVKKHFTADELSNLRRPWGATAS